MERFRKIASAMVFALQVLIIFFIVFENRIAIPATLQAIGRMHPLLLHLPIGLLLVAALLHFLKRYFENERWPELISFVLLLTALTASLTTFMGLVLSKEGGYDDTPLLFHKWFGISLSFICWALTIAPRRIFTAAIVASVIVLLFTGHFGATLTHGDQMVLEPLLNGDQERAARVVTDSSTIFYAAVDPILEAKCHGCHNTSKSKGRLILATMDGLLKGGKHGKLYKPGDSGNSLIVERLALPLDEKEHMPPKDKAQLTEAERKMISSWIADGASFTRRLSDLSAGDSLATLAEAIIPTYAANDAQQKYDFAFAANDKVASLSIPNRSVYRLARNEPALEASFYLRDSFTPEYLRDLLAVKEQIVSLNLSNMPVDDAQLEQVSKFPNLEKLILNGTPITGTGFNNLVNAKNLKVLSVSGSKVEAKNLAHIGKIPTITDVFFWNTNVPSGDVESLRKQFSRVRWHSGYQPDANEVLKLNPPLRKNDASLLAADELILLKHNLPGAIIRYAIGGNPIDSVNGPVYVDPITIDKYTVIKTKAFKPGWKTSDEAEFIFFKRGATPTDASLLTKSDAKYEGGGVSTLTDGQQGMPDFYRDVSWIGFRSEKFDAVFKFSGKDTISSVTMSHARNVWALCFPPEALTVYAGDDANNLKPIAQVKPQQPTTWVSNRTEGTTVSIPAATYRVIRIVATPLRKIPAFRNEKKQTGWLMMDEIYFN